MHLSSAVQFEDSEALEASVKSKACHQLQFQCSFTFSNAYVRRALCAQNTQNGSYRMQLHILMLQLITGDVISQDLN